MSIHQFFWVFWFSHLSAAISNSFHNITVNSNKNLYQNTAALFQSPCNNVSLPSFDGLNIRISVIRNLGFGGCLTSGLPYRQSCIKPSASNFSLADFCSFLILPTPVNNLYSSVEQGLASPIQTTSLLLNVTGSNNTNGQIMIFESMELFVIWDLTDLSRWMPFFGNYGGGYNNASCNPNQHVQIIRYHVLDNFHGDNAFYFLNFKCSDGKYYKPNAQSSNYADYQYVECVQSFGINGFTVFYGTEQAPTAIKIFCGSYKRPVTVLEPSAINETYFCRPGSIVTGFQYFSGLIVEGFGPHCTPANIRIALKSISLDMGNLEIALNSTNINITSDVGDVRYSRINVSILSLEPSEYQVSFKGEKLQEVRYLDISVERIIVRLKTIPRQPIQLLVSVNSGVGSIVSAKHDLDGLDYLATKSTPQAEVPETSRVIEIVSIAIGSLIIVLSGIFLILKQWYHRKRSAVQNIAFASRSNERLHESSNTEIEMKISSDPAAKHPPMTSDAATKKSAMGVKSIQTPKSPTDYELPTSDTTKSISTEPFSGSSVLYVPGYLKFDFERDISIIEEGKLGIGGTAVIIKANIKSPVMKSRFGDIPLAIKVMNMNRREVKVRFKYEVALLASLPASPNIVKFIGYSEKPLCIAMKLYKFCLDEIFMNFEDNAMLKYMVAHDIANGMKLVHGCGIIHLDLKLSNILIDTSPNFHCVISDFGFSSRVGTSMQVVKGLQLPSIQGHTVRYAAAEILQRTKPRYNAEEDKKIDVYAYGVLISEVIARTRAWKDVSVESIREKVIQGERPQFGDDDIVGARFAQVPALTKLVESCLSHNAFERPSFNDIHQSICLNIAPSRVDDPVSSSSSFPQSTTYDFSSTIEEMFQRSPNK